VFTASLLNGDAPDRQECDSASIPFDV